MVEAAYNQLIGDLRWLPNGDGNTISERPMPSAAPDRVSKERVAKSAGWPSP